MRFITGISQFFAICVLIPLLILVNFARAEPNEPDSTFASLQHLAKTYAIEISTTPTFPVKTASGLIDGKEADGKAMQQYAPLFIAEFSLYPPDLVKRTRLKRIVLCNDVSFAGQRRNAIPDYEHDTLYLDASRGFHSKPYMRKVIHHEFFHIIDYRDDGHVYKDERWASLNPATFKYGSGGKNAQDQRDTSILTDKNPGFLNGYSTTAVEEDKAEIFAALIVDRAYVEDRVKKEPVLKAKVVRMKELLAKFCPDMNDKFWERVRLMKRD